MKQKLLLKSLLLLCCLFVGASAWGVELPYKTALFGKSYNSVSVSGYNNVSFTATNNGFAVNLVNFNNNGNAWDYVKCGSKNDAYTGTISTTNAIDKAITKVVIQIDAITASKVTSIKLFTSSDNSSWTSVGEYTKATGSQSVALSTPTTNLYYKIEFVCQKGTSNGLVTVSKVEYYYEDPNGVNSPVITVSENDYGPKTISMSCETNGADIYYTTDGTTTPTTSSAKYENEFTLSESCTIKAIAYYNGNKSQISSANVKYVAWPEITLASLPFEFDGNAASATNENGFINKSIGSYSSSPKLQFDATGDYLILGINDSPGQLSFDIKGNSFSGGTFTVETSSDLQTWTNLATYTELATTTVNKEYSLSATTRYIKWIYTSKSSGNVALGNISLTKAGVVLADSKITFADGNTHVTYVKGLTYERPATATYGDNNTAIDASLVSYESSNTSVATVDANGKLTVLRAGTTKITASVEASNDYKSSSASYYLDVDYPLTIQTEEGYATFYIDMYTAIPEGLTAYMITGNEASAEGGKLTLTPFEGSVIPSKCAVLVKGTKDATYLMAYTSSSANDTDKANMKKNMLYGSVEAGTTTAPAADSDYLFYKLSYNDGTLGFYWGAENGGAFTSNANMAYLAIPAPTTVSVVTVKGYSLAGNETGIEDVASSETKNPVIYDLSGRQVKKAQKGVYIINGKKVLF